MTRRTSLFLLLLATASARAADPAPDLALLINGQGSGVEKPLSLTRGEPVIVEITLQNPGDTPMLLHPPTGSWATRVRVAVTGAPGKAATWTFEITGKPSPGALALQPDAVTTLVLRMPLKDAGDLAPGSYRATATLDLADGKGWQGVAQSEPITIAVIDAPAAPTGAVLGERQLLRVKDALLAADLPRAEQATRELLLADVQRPEGFVAQALVAEARGERAQALIAIDMAITRAVEQTIKAAPPATKPAATRPAARPPAPTGIKPRPVPLEYYDLRERLENMPPAPPK